MTGYIQLSPGMFSYGGLLNIGIVTTKALKNSTVWPGLSGVRLNHRRKPSAVPETKKET